MEENRFQPGNRYLNPGFKEVIMDSTEKPVIKEWEKPRNLNA